MDHLEFETQRRKFEKYGRAADPDKPKELVGQERPPQNSKRPRTSMGSAADTEGYLGPWAGFEGEKRRAEPNDEERARFLNETAHHAPAMPITAIEMGQEQTVFHGKEERDYMGRTYMHVPADLDVRLDKTPGSFECFAPKRLVHTWTGHTKGVSVIRLVPISGHLLLSGSQDTKLKLWQVYGDRMCLRTMLGHKKPVRDASFAVDGRRFASCAYDRTVKYWDTETGRCVTAIETASLPFCVKVHPDPDKTHIVMAGCGDRRILQWDMRSGAMVQEYSQHLDAVNTITFFDQNRRFVSTSDDKSVRVWEWDIPVTTKYIADPEMHSMPAAALHPEGTHVAFQSLANQVVIYSVQSKFQQRRKKFVGHSTAGYACQLSFSPDGRFLASGDGRGQLIVWDWKTGQLIRRIEAHSKVCIGVEWSPQEPSKIVTCSWDGTIKYWD